ncbi:ankyrin repeat-containing protein [Aspergillus arachidicola]|uniref:Ankyrin repeat-containing protein n=2 Tax=Aspergillus arachidicola TaxID=656916 RepID=A0A2G7FS92_9EURO|nr:ankyrin repeat-containing protein [Aspergillus arachidicola]
MSGFLSSHSLQTPKEYYSSFKANSNLQEKFHNIDDEAQFRAYLGYLQDVQTWNFVLDFGNDDAWCAVDLEEEDIATLLRSVTITSHYGISERLQGMMCTDPVARPSQSTSPLTNGLREKNDERLPRVPGKNDLEEAQELKDLSDPAEIQAAASFRGLTFAHVTNQIWHFCSVDYDTCIGYNSLFVVPNVESPNGQGLPDGRRLWSWLILCDDEGTVISIQENPYPGLVKPSERELKSVLGIIRRNVQLIFSGVSKRHSAQSESDSLVTIRVRPAHGDGPDQASIKQEDGPSLLFYYIFDDWVSSYALVAKREHQYGVLLDRLREEMLGKPVVGLVNELHWLGRRLAVLKRLYQSYELIMMRILQRQRHLRDEAKSNRPPLPIGPMFGESEVTDLRQPTLQSSLSFSGNADTSVGVQLSSPAVARFERLLDRIKLYCLSEIDTCLTEKESLTFLNFNLIALKDSQAVEKLTRITILLAKVTILFLPVSLMTAYFSTELKNVKGVPRFKPTKQPKPTIIALLGLGGPERDVFIEQVTGIIPDDRNPKNKGDLFSTRIFKGQVNDRDLWLLDTPSLEIPVAELVEGINSAVARKSGRTDYAIDGIVYLHDITDTNVTQNASENLSVFQRLLRSASPDRIVFVTTFWDLLRTQEEGVRTEAKLNAVYGSIASICRVLDSSDGQSYREIIWDAASGFVDAGSVEDSVDDDAMSTPTVEELLSIIYEKDKRMACLETELHATKETFARQLQDVQQKAADEKATLYQQLQAALKDVNQLKEDLGRSQKSCLEEMRNLRKQFEFRKQDSNHKLRAFETQQLSSAGDGHQNCWDMTPTRSFTQKPPHQAHRLNEEASSLNVLDARGEFPLYSAAAGGYYDEVKRLLEQGANPSMRTLFQWTALHWAVGNGHANIVQLLLDYGADINAISDTGSTPLDMARNDMMKGILRQRGAR